eukprot:scpid44037/ scgid27278/ Proline dehydrogenase 1, mitochondrial; Proline oxidase; Proline oxidase 2; p53-induced gene 6 protein
MKLPAPLLGRALLGGRCSRGTASISSDSGTKVNGDNLSFDFPEFAYKSKRTREIARAVFVLRLFSFESIVNNNKKLTQLARKVLGERLFNYTMKSTVYGQFIAGTDRQTIQPVLDRYRRLGVKSILDYAVEEDVSDEGVLGPVQEDEIQVKEDDQHRLPKFKAYKEFADRRQLTPLAASYFYEGEDKCNERMNVFMQAIDAAAMQGDGFVAVKLTALGQTSFLLHLSSILQQVRFMFDSMTDQSLPMMERYLTKETFTEGLKKMGISTPPGVIEEMFHRMDTTTDDGKIDVIDFIYFFRPSETPYTEIFMKRDKHGIDWPLVDNFTRREELQMRSVSARLDALAQAAKEKNISLMVDAEQSYFQPAINRLTTKVMKKYNVDRPVVLNTYQCYLKETADLLQRDIELARRFNIRFGAKLVRGAYMEQERERATSVGYADPVHDDYAATTHCYNAAMDMVMREVADRGAGMMVASHNEDTVRTATQSMKKYGLSSDHHGVSFGQLLGMSDHVSFELGRSGYNAYKYMPYGPVDEVLAYLSRRANENRGLLRGAERERKLLENELLHRLSFGAFRRQRPSSV